MHFQVTQAVIAGTLQDYIAVSYYWGGENDRRTVFVHELGGKNEVQILSITATLYSALQRTWHVYLYGAPTSSLTGTSKLFWADGICIQ
jgi:hypothetical protein